MATNIPIVVADVELQLSTAISVGDTSFSLSSATDDDGNALPAGKYCFTVNNGTTNKEYLIGQLNGTDVTSVVSVSRQGVESSGAARAHRVGDTCIVTNFASLQRVADTLRGEDPLDSGNPIYYDAEPTLTDREQVATVAYVLDNVTGGTVAFDNQVVTGVNAGETVAAGDLVYFKTSDQEWYKTDADTAATVENVQIGIALGSGTDGVAITGGVQISGVYTTSGLTAGDTYYASNTAGEYTNSAGAVGAVIGVALSTTRLLLAPNSIKTPNYEQKQFLNATTGMISMYAGTSAPAGFLLCDGSAVSRTTYADLYAITGDSYGAGDGATTFNVPDLRSSFPLGYGQKVLTFTFVDGDVNTSTEEITIDSNDYIQTGTALALTTSGTLPTGLSATTYYAIRVSATVIKLASSVANADDGTAVNITAASGGGTHTLTLTLTQRDMGDDGGEETHALTTAEMPSHTHPPGSPTTDFQGREPGSNDGWTDQASGEGSASTTGSAGGDTPHNNMPPYVTVNYIIKT